MALPDVHAAQQCEGGTGYRTKLETETTRVGKTVRMNVEVTNLRDTLQAMAIAKLGIPAGCRCSPWQLKELIEKKQGGLCEMFDNYLVLYWMGFAAEKKADQPGPARRRCPAITRLRPAPSTCIICLKHKNWSEGTRIQHTLRED